MGLRLLTGLGLLELYHLIYPRLLRGFGMMFFFTNLVLMELQVRCLVLFLLFSVTDGSEWFWTGGLHKNIQLILEFLLDLFLVLYPIRDTVDWSRKWLVDFNAGEFQATSFDQCCNTGAIDVKTEGSVLEEKSSLEMLGLTFSSK